VFHLQPSPLYIYHDFCWPHCPSSHRVLSLYSSNFFCTACCSWSTMMMKNARTSETLLTITRFLNVYESFPRCSVSVNTPVLCAHFYPNIFGACPLQVEMASCCEALTTTYNITGCHNQEDHSEDRSFMLLCRLHRHSIWICACLSQMKHQLDATLCRFYFCRVILHVSGASAHHQEYLKLVRRPLVHAFCKIYNILTLTC